MKLYYPITVDLYNPYPLPRMNAQQYNVGRGALVTLTANGQVIAPNDETVRIFARRPDGNVSYLDCTITEDGKVQADFTDQMLAAEGNVQVELEFTTTETNITTPIFVVEVNKSNVKKGVQSSNEYKALEKYTEEVKEAANKAQEYYNKTPSVAIISTAQGKTILTTDSANAPLVNLVPKGDSWQRQYEGNQLLPPSTGSSVSFYGVNVTNNNDGTFLVNGTATDYIYYDVGVYNFGAGDYVLSGCPSGGNYDTYNIYIEKDGTRLVSDYGEGVNFSLTETSELTIYIYVRIGETCNNLTFKPMIRSASVTDGTWEPFTGNAPSPSMEYPQPIESLENVEVKVLSGNLFDVSKVGNYSSEQIETLGYGMQVAVDGSIKVVSNEASGAGIADLIGSKLSDIAPFLQVGETYTLNAITTASVRKWIYLLGANESWDFGTSKVVTEEILNSIVYWYTNDINETCYISDIMLNLGKEPLPYEPYKAEQTLTIPYVLRKGDRIPYAEGKREQNSAEYVFTGEEDFVDLIPSYGTITMELPHKSNSLLLCTHGIKEQGIFYPNDMFVGFRVSEMGITTVDELREILREKYNSGNPCKIVYELPDPIITDLTESDLQAYRQLHMNYPNTTVISDAELEVEYVADTKEHIKQNYVPKNDFEDLKNQVAEIQAQLVNA